MIARDITERKRAEQYRSTLLALTGVLASRSTLDEAAPQVLEQIGRNLGKRAPVEGTGWACRCRSVLSRR